MFWHKGRSGRVRKTSPPPGFDSQNESRLRLPHLKYFYVHAYGIDFQTITKRLVESSHGNNWNLPARKIRSKIGKLCLVILLSSNHFQNLVKEVKQDSLLYPHLSAPPARTLRATQCYVCAFLLAHLRIAFGARRRCSFAFYFYWPFHIIAMVSCGRQWTFRVTDCVYQRETCWPSVRTDTYTRVRFVFQLLIY